MSVEQAIITEGTVKEIEQSQIRSSEPLSVLVITWNLMGHLPDYDNLMRLLTAQRISHDLIVIGTQECQRSQLMSFCCDDKKRWEMMLQLIFSSTHNLAVSYKMNGIHIVAFLRETLENQLTVLSRGLTKTGLKGLTGNKGAVCIQIAIGIMTFTFIAAHLEAHHEKFNDRNKNLNKIVRKMTPDNNSDYVFIFGDLNYRMDIRRSEANQITNLIGLEQYIQYDQLKQQVLLSDFLRQYKQGQINFAPTYKMIPNSTEYDNSRIPGWTDRIFYKAKNNDCQVQYYTGDFSVTCSDHRPVLASFKTPYVKKIIKQRISLLDKSCCIF